MASTTNASTPLTANETGVYLPRVPTKPLLDTIANASRTSEHARIPEFPEFAWNEHLTREQDLSESLPATTEEPATDSFNEALAIENEVLAIEDVLLANASHRSSTILESLEAPLSITASNLSWLSNNPDDNVELKASLPLSAPCQIAGFPVSSVWGLDFHCVNMQQALDGIDQIVRERKPTFAVTANLNYAMLCAQHPRLKEFTRQAALVLCDGMPILWRSKGNKNQLPERVAGSDLIYRLAERSAKTKLRLYLYGAAEGVAIKAAMELSRLYPGCNIVGVQSPPFRATSEAEVQSQIAQIQQAKPDVLLVALGQPKGEYWIEDNLQRLNVPLSIQVGASFDFVAGNAQRAPKMWQRLGCEWLYRMLKDPRRLAPRYFKNAIQLLKFLQRDCIDWLDSDSNKHQNGTNAVSTRPSASVSTTSRI